MELNSEQYPVQSSRISVTELSDRTVKFAIVHDSVTQKISNWIN